MLAPKADNMTTIQSCAKATAQSPEQPAIGRAEISPGQGNPISYPRHPRKMGP